MDCYCVEAAGCQSSWLFDCCFTEGCWKESVRHVGGHLAEAADSAAVFSQVRPVTTCPFEQCWCTHHWLKDNLCMTIMLPSVVK